MDWLIGRRGFRWRSDYGIGRLPLDWFGIERLRFIEIWIERLTDAKRVMTEDRGVGIHVGRRG